MKNTKHKTTHDEASFEGDRKRTRAITVESPNIPGIEKEMAERQYDTRAYCYHRKKRETSADARECAASECTEREREREKRR